MAATRPVVLVFQEFASLSSSPATPSLNCLVAGAGYWFQDFPDDRDAIKLTASYGVLNTAATGSTAAPVSGDQVVITDAPNNKVGAVLDFPSVKAYFGHARAELLNVSDAVTANGSSVVKSATSFLAAGVLAGDFLTLTNSGPATLAKKIRSVGAYLQASTMNFLAAGVGAGSVLTLSGDAASTTRNGTYIVAQVLSATELLLTTDFAGGSESGSASLLIKSAAGVNQLALTTGTVATSPAVVLTDEMPASGYTKARAERQLADAQIDPSFVLNDSGTNHIRIQGAVTLSVGGVQKPIVSADIYVAYRSLRQDLAKVTTINDVNALIGLFGRTSSAGAKLSGIDARNPLAVGAFVALSNTNTPIQVFGVASDDLVGYNAMKGTISGRSDIYAVVPLTRDINVIASLNAEFVNLADPAYALTNGTPQKFRVVIGSPGVLPTVSIIADVSQNGSTQAVAGTAPTNLRVITFPSGDLIASGVLPGDSIVVSGSVTVAHIANGTYHVTHVLSATAAEVAEDLGVSAGTSDITAVINIGTSSTPRVATASYAATASSALGNLFLDLYDPAATFIDSGVIPGDIIEMPLNPNQTSFTAKQQFVVALVMSNSRLRVVNNGPDTVLLENTLPHGATRNAPVTLIPTSQTLAYRVVRTLDKSGQVTALVAVAQSVRSKRTVLVWPDKVTVAGLTDGSLTRDPSLPLVPQPAAPQPGFYLACAVGGMTAGLPSHQGFTNMGIAGVSEIFDSNTYFTDKNLTDLSNGGWFLFIQDDPSALPTVVHELTTDVSTLQFGEFMMVKNFDYVSLFFSDILAPFLGIWNINDETLGFISAALQSGIDSLKLQRRVRIGAPIIGATITSLAPSTIAADRLEIFVEVTFPKPLNVVGLHLVSV